MIVPLHNGSAPDFGSGCGGSIPPGTTETIKRERKRLKNSRLRFLTTIEEH